MTDSYDDDQQPEQQQPDVTLQPSSSPSVAGFNPQFAAQEMAAKFEQSKQDDVEGAVIGLRKQQAQKAVVAWNKQLRDELDRIQGNPDDDARFAKIRADYAAEKAKAAAQEFTAADDAGKNFMRQFVKQKAAEGQAVQQAPLRGAIQGTIEAQQGASTVLGGTQTLAKLPPMATPGNDLLSKLLETPIETGYKDPNWWVANFLYKTSASYPSLGMGMAGTAAGSRFGAAGSIAGGSAGFAMGSALQTIVPAYQQARAEGLTHDQAVDRAMSDTKIAAAFGAAMGLAPGVSLFGKTATGALRAPISEALAQIFGVQPALMTGQHVATEIAHGHDISMSETARAAAEGMFMGVAFAGGHAAWNARGIGRRGTTGPRPDVEGVLPPKADADAQKALDLEHELGTLATDKSAEAEAQKAELSRQLLDAVIKQKETTVSEPESVGNQPANDGATTFRTAKGSIYTVHDDGTTTRNKALRDESGHEGDEGEKPRSQSTFYVDDEGALKLAEIQAEGAQRAIEVRGDKAAVRYLEGDDAGKFERRTLTDIRTEPDVGLTPVELWDDGKTVHFGNKITDVSRPGNDEKLSQTQQPRAPSEAEIRERRDRDSRLDDGLGKLIDSNVPRSEWGLRLGADGEELASAIDRAVAAGRLRIDDEGKVRRATPPKSATPSVVPADLLARHNAPLAPSVAHDRIADAIKEAMPRLPKGTTVKTFADLAGYVPGKKNIDAVYEPAARNMLLSRAAMESRPIEGTLAHETFHALREAGLVSDDELAILADRARKIPEIVEQTKVYRDLYENRPPKVRDENIKQELAAHLLEARRNGADFGSKISPILDRILEFFERLRNALKGRGFQSWEDVARSIESGEVAAREKAEREAEQKKQFIVGIHEHVTLPDLGVGLPVKVDTGAQTSSLHAVDIKEVGDNKVQFTTETEDGDKTHVADIVDKRVIKSSNGTRQTRYVIRTTARIGAHERPIDVTLTNRGSMDYGMLLGREAMQGMVVDPNSAYLHGDGESAVYAAKPEDDYRYEEGKLVNKDGKVMLLPYEKEWGDPRFDEEDKQHALNRLYEIQTMPMADVPWSEVVQARRDIDQIISNLFFYDPTVPTREGGRTSGDVSEYMREHEHGGPLQPVDVMRPSIFRDKIVPPDMHELVDAGMQALDHLIESRRAGIKGLLRDWDEREPASRRQISGPKSIGEQTRSGFYFKAGRELGKVSDAVFQQGGQAVIDALRQAGVSRAEVQHFRLSELANQKPASRDAFERQIADRMFEMRRQTSWLNPERSKNERDWDIPGIGYRLGGTRAFTGPRIPGRGIYFERKMAFPSRLKGGEPFAPGMFKSPHWEETYKGTWASTRGSVREVPEYGRMLIGEEQQSDLINGANTGRRPRLSQQEFLAAKAERTKYNRVMSTASDLAYTAFGYSGRGTKAFALRRQLSPRGDMGMELHPEAWKQAIKEGREHAKAQRDENHPERVYSSTEEANAALDKLEKLRADNEKYFTPGAKARYGETETSFTPQTPIDESYVRTMVRDLLMAAAEKQADSVAISTTDTTGRIQNNPRAAHFYDQQLKPSLEKELRRITGDDTLSLDKVNLPKAMGAPKREKPYTVWATKLDKETLQQIKSEGMPLFAARPGDAGAQEPRESDAYFRANLADRLARGESVDVHPEVIKRQNEVLSDLRGIIPDGSRIYVGSIARIEPVPGKDGIALVALRVPDGRTLTFHAPVDYLAERRAGSLLFTRGRRILYLSGYDAAPSREVLRGGAAHELIHVLRDTEVLNGPVWSDLLRHAEASKVMDKPLRAFFEVIGHPSARFAPEGETIRQAYHKILEGRDDYHELMNQEAVAHWVELQNAYDPLLTELMLRRVASGEWPRVPLDMTRGVEDQPLFAARGFGVHIFSNERRGPVEMAPEAEAKWSKILEDLHDEVSNPGRSTARFAGSDRQTADESRAGTGEQPGAQSAAVAGASGVAGAESSRRQRTDDLVGPTTADLKSRFDQLAEGSDHKQAFDFVDALPMDQASRDARAEAQGFSKETWFHGTGAEFTEFDPAHQGKNSGGTYGSKYGFFFADREATARSGIWPSSRVVGARLRMENPYVLDVPKYLREEYQRLTAGYNPFAHIEAWLLNREASRVGVYAAFEPMLDSLAAGAFAHGHDGIILDFGKDSKIGRVAIVPKPNQIRSPQAAFDPDKAHLGNLLYAGRHEQLDLFDPINRIQDKLGLFAPDAGKSKDAKPRQFILNIANNGALKLQGLLSEPLRRLMEAHAAELTPMADPRVLDPVGDGFDKFFSDFITHPDYANARAPRFAEAFKDMLDGHDPELLHDMQTLQSQSADRIALRKTRAATGMRPQPPKVDPAVTTALSRIPGVEEAKSLGHAFSGMKDYWIDTMQPELRSDGAFLADALLAKGLSERRQGTDALMREAEHESNFWRSREVISTPEGGLIKRLAPDMADRDAENIAYMHRVQTGAAQPDSELQARQWRHRKMFDTAYKQDVLSGAEYHYLEDYFTQLWDRPDDVKSWIEMNVKKYGPDWFTKKREFEFMTDGLRAGFRLISTNPEELATKRLTASVHMRALMDILADLKGIEMAQEAEGADPQLAAGGWQAINAPNGKQWLLAPDIQALWKNAIDAKGLWSQEGGWGNAFRAWMGYKAIVVPIKLAISGFHPLHVMHINMSQGIAMGWKALREGRGADAMTSFRSGYDPIGSAIGAFLGGATGGVPGAVLGAHAGGIFGASLRTRSGRDARAAWEKPIEERTPDEDRMVQLMTDGGFVPNVSVEMENRMKGELARAIVEHKFLKAIPLGLLKIQEHTLGQIFERWIPNIKAGAYIAMASNELRSRPELLADDVKRSVALRAIAKTVDDRYGQMNYQGLFQNRMFKDSMIGAMLSYGWQLGFLRTPVAAIGDAPIKIARKVALMEPLSEGRQVASDASDKLAYALIYGTTAAMLAGTMTWFYTGEMPKDATDFVFPRIGGLNPDGSPRRVTQMSYVREIPMWVKHYQQFGGGSEGVVKGTGEMAMNKSMLGPLWDLARNRDYFGNDIYDPNAPDYEKVWQALTHELRDQFGPITVTGAKRAAGLSGRPFEWDTSKPFQSNMAGLARSMTAKGVPESMLGFGPAPAYAERSALQNAVSASYERYVKPFATPWAKAQTNDVKRDARSGVFAAEQSGDPQKVVEARQAAARAGVDLGAMAAQKMTPTAVYMFQRLPKEAQAGLLERFAGSDELKPYLRAADWSVQRDFKKAHPQQ